MAKRRLFSEKQKNGMQLLCMILLTCISQVLALYKSRFTAVNFGASSVMDAYNYALNIATFVFVFITSGVTTVVIPAYVKKKSAKTINSFITIIFGAILIIVVLIIMGSTPLLNLLTNKGDNFVGMVSSFMFITFLIQGITSFLAVTAAYYQCINHYIVPKSILLFANALVAVILMTGVITDIHMYLGLLVGGSVVNLIFDLGVAIRYGFRYIPGLNLKDPELKAMLLIFLPTMFSSGVYKIHILVDTMVAATLISGTLTILSYSTQIISMVNNVVIGNLTVYAYPKIVSRIDKPDCKKFFWTYSIFFHSVVVLIIAGFINVGFEGVKLIFFGGKFTLEDTKLLYYCVCVFIFGQQFNVVRDLIYRFFYSNGNTKETLKNSVSVSVINIVLSIVLAKFMGVMGIIVATGLSSIFSLVTITIRFHKYYNIGLSLRYLVIEHAKNLGALVVSVGAVQIFKKFLIVHNDILAIIVYGVLTVVIYVAVLLVLKSDARKISF